MDRPKLILLCGIPGSGKTYHAKKYIETHQNTIHLSSDAIRAELYGDESIQGDPNEVFSLMQKRAVEALNNGQSVVYDSTAMTRKDRSGIIAVCPRFVKIECHIVWAPIETCIERDAARERTVGREVIDRMLKRMQSPYYDEGIDEINVIYPYDFDFLSYKIYMYDKMNIEHENPHHKLNVQNHCAVAEWYAIKKSANNDVVHAAMWHDIGKPYVKSFIDGKGNPCETAHYYQHQCVGAWLAYGISSNPLVSWLVSSHMEPYFNSKYYNNLPVYLKNMVDQLHECDLAAH